MINPDQISEIPKFEDLPRHYAEFFDLVEIHRGKRQYDFSYFSSVDAEWRLRHNLNHLLSTQLAVCSRTASVNRMYLAPKGKRPTLAEIVERGIRSVHGDAFPESHLGKRIIFNIVCHHSTAEMSILEDRDKPAITEAISLVRRAPVTLRDPIKVMLENGCLVHVRLYDTILIAPATHRSLKKLSTLLGKEGETKENISQYHIENMDVFLREYPELFERYALKDTAITLRLFFLLQKSLNLLTTGQVTRLYMTIGSASVHAFVHENQWVKKYLKRLRSEEFVDAIRLVRRAYFGGRNEGLLRGRTSRYAQTRHKAWVDIDLVGAYPSFMALIPLIDFDGEILRTFITYEINDEQVEELVRDNVPRQLVEEARQALQTSPRHFEYALRRMKRSIAKRIRSTAQVFNNDLVNRWYSEWRLAKERRDDSLFSYLVPGFACIEFQFPRTTLYPCLHVHHSRYGLQYPYAGQTVATHLEIMQAMDAGAKVNTIWSIEFPVQRDASGAPVMYLQAFLKRLAEKRDEHKTAAKKGNATAGVYEKLLKELMNSLYGKFSQGINPRRVCDAATFEMKRLGPSKVSDPIVAALTTGGARATLSSMLLATEQFNRQRRSSEWIDIASCTTDGALFGLPSGEGFSVLDTYYCEKEVVHETGV